MRYFLQACFLALLFLAIAPVPASAQGNIDWEERWRNAPPFPPQHALSWMNDSLSYTRLAYDEQRDVVYVVSPHPAGAGQWSVPSIHILDAATGQSRMDLGRSAHFARNGQGGELPVPLDTFMTVNNNNLGFGENWFALYNIDVDDEGRIYACNLVEPLWGICMLLPGGGCDPMYLYQGPFRVWRWDTPTSTPELIYATCNTAHSAIGTISSSEMPYTRWGDGFAVSGKRAWYQPPAGGPPVLVDSTRIYVTSGQFGAPGTARGYVAVLVEDRRPAASRPLRDVTGGGRLSHRLGHLMDLPSQAAAHGIALESPTFAGDTLQRWIWLHRHGEFIHRVRERHSAGAVLPDASTPAGPDLQAVAGTGTNLYLFGPSGSMQFLQMPQSGRSYLATADAWPYPGSGAGLPTPNTSAHFVDVTTWGQHFQIWGPTPQVGMSPLWSVGMENYISDVDLKLDYDSSISRALLLQMFVLMSNNAIVSFRSRPFAVDLVALDVQWSDGAAVVEWVVAAEEHIIHYAVERGGFEYGPWRHAGTVAATGGSGDLRYRFVDAGAASAAGTSVTTWYRLTAVEYDGSRKSFPAVALRAAGETSPLSLSLFPQPALRQDGLVYMRIQSPASDAVTLRVTDVLGREVLPVRRFALESGGSVLPLQLAGLNAGLYLLEARSSGAAPIVRRLLVR